MHDIIIIIIIIIITGKPVTRDTYTLQLVDPGYRKVCGETSHTGYLYPTASRSRVQESLW